MTVDDTYSTLEDAKIEIWKRFNNQSLKKEIETFLGVLPLSLLPYQHTPIAWHAVHVVSPDISLHHFVKLAEEIQLPPVVSQHLEDKFCPENKAKYHLGKLCFSEGIGKHGGHKTSYFRTINLDTWKGKPLNEITTLWGENFVDFHHSMLLHSKIANKIKTFGFYKWRMHNASKIDKFYIHFLSLSLCHGVLFENYLTNGNEADFSNNIYLPAFEKVQSLFGIKPLVVRLAPKESEDDLYWYCYPDYLKPIVYEHITRQNPDFLIK